MEEDIREYGYSKIGERCFGKYEYNKRSRLNLIGGLLNNQLIAPLYSSSSIDSDTFYEYVKEILVKQIPKNCIIVLDNASFHKRADIKQIISDYGHKILYLPTYSPHLNPIEHKWAQMKAYRKKYRIGAEELFEKFF